ncbi:MAG: hypothetical protein ACI8P9_005420 [Parasphingorhabdus sp.]|jgi:hypothetical protein
MIQGNLLYIAMAVFAIMIVGIILTVVEFRYGAPAQQVRDQTISKHPKR